MKACKAILFALGIAFLPIVIFAVGNYLWHDRVEPSSGYNVAIGYWAGYDITDENLQFRFTVDGKESEYEYCTTMTMDEYKAVSALVIRASQNKRKLQKPLGATDSDWNEPVAFIGKRK
jgi:hypothetical protein